MAQNDIGSIAKKMVETAKTMSLDDGQKQQIIESTDDQIFGMAINMLLEDGTPFLGSDQYNELRSQIEALGYFETLRSRAR